MVDLAPQAAGTSSLEDSLKSLSSEEITKFEKSFKDPKFMELLADYAKDIADPQTRAEQDQYIRQLEEEGRGQEVYGKGMQLVTPTAVFVAKTANKQSGQKIFINVCTSDKVVVATSKRQKNVDGTTKPGLLWDVPLMLGNQKEGSDRNRIQCIVFDFVVHPDTCRMALNNAKFKGMILDSAVDNIEKVTGWTLTRHYSFPKLAFKSTPGVDRPSTVSFRTDMQGGSTTHPRQENMPDSSNRQHSGSTAGSATLAKPLVTELPPDSAAKGAGAARSSEGVLNGVVQPQYEIVYRGQVDLSEAWEGPGINAAAARCPKELVIRSQMQRLTKNQRKWLELHPVASTSAPSPAEQSEAALTVETVSPDTLLAAAAAGDLFIACDAFQQQIPGYVFTTQELD
ncbi:hypothetical protein WJX79_007249 [Trebouxia sp. C0005]